MTYESIHKNYFKRLAWFAGNLINDFESGKDIASESLIKLWYRFGKFDNERAIKSFLYLITKRACLDFLRHKKHVARSFDDIYYITERTEQDITYLIIEAEVLAEITNGIEKLPKSERNIFKLFFLHHMTVQEVIDKTGLKKSTIFNQRAIAINHLRQKMINRK